MLIYIWDAKYICMYAFIFQALILCIYNPCVCVCVYVKQIEKIQSSGIFTYFCPL